MRPSLWQVKKADDEKFPWMREVKQFSGGLLWSEKMKLEFPTVKRKKYKTTSGLGYLEVFS